MYIIVDIGNTNTKTAIYSNNVLVYAAVIDPENVQKCISELQKFNPTHGIISQVSGKTGSWQADFPTTKWLILDYQTPVPFCNTYQTPQTLGLDRIALAAASANFDTGNVLAIDAGTCITFDFKNDKNEYLGGSIAPGIYMRYRALQHFTAKLPLVESISEAALVGRTTQSSIQSGVLNGVVAEIDGIINRYITQFGATKVVLCGGDTLVLAPLIKNSIFATPNFLLEGLHVILKYNSV